MSDDRAHLSPNPSNGDVGGHSVLIVDDIQDNVTMLGAHLKAKGYTTLAAYNGIDALKLALRERPDLIMLDINMPQLSGLDVCAQLKQHKEARHIPIILVTANSETEDIVRGFEVGADDYLIKPYNYMEMLARVRSMLRIKDAQAQLVQANKELDEWNRNLERKVKQQVAELQRVNRLRRFFSPQLVERIVAERSDANEILREHRGDISVVFLDLRHFTPFAEGNSPQTVIQTVRNMHETVGPIIFRFNGTLERFTGDGLMVFLGDPEPMADHPVQAVRMSIAIREGMSELVDQWCRNGYNLQLGIGVASGVASMGTIGFEGRLDYAAIGSVTNLASRICGQAEGGQILIDESTQQRLGDELPTRACGEIDLRGFSRMHTVYEVL